MSLFACLHIPTGASRVPVTSAIRIPDARHSTRTGQNARIRQRHSRPVSRQPDIRKLCEELTVEYDPFTVYLREKKYFYSGCFYTHDVVGHRRI